MSDRSERTASQSAHVSHLLIYVSDLEPDVDLGKRRRRVAQDEAEALYRSANVSDAKTRTRQSGNPRRG